MFLFRKLSLRRKQTLILMLTSSVALLVACAAFLAYDTASFRKDLVEKTFATANVLGANCAAALDFNDPKSAGETLASLSAEPNISSAAIYAKDGSLFASYHRKGGPEMAPLPVTASTGHKFVGEELGLFRPIVVHSETLGTIYLAHDLRQLNQRMRSYLGIAALVLAASLLVTFALSSQLQRVISDPILHLARLSKSVAVDRDYSVRATKQSDDELGELMDGFNEMLVQIQERDNALQIARNSLEKRVEDRTRELEKTHLQLVEASRRGGMAEIATNVLHNVGNVLNSVNISAGLIVEQVKKSRASSLTKIVVLLGEHEHDLGEFLSHDARGKHVPALLAQVSERLLADQAAIVSELGSLRENIEHIKEIVAMQQSYATFGGVKELINVVDLVEDSLHINEASLSRHGVKIIREFAEAPELNMEKHKILQILVNLIRNAKYACQESDRVDKRISLRVGAGGGRVLVTVIDNGVGIPPENLTRIFNHGFTTRKGGHGFGLHSGALAAMEMGGSLTVRSDGAGLGATFTLELPCSPPENANA